MYINPNTEIALLHRMKKLASHLSFAAVNDDLTVSNIRFTGSDNASPIKIS